MIRAGQSTSRKCTKKLLQLRKTEFMGSMLLTKGLRKGYTLRSKRGLLQPRTSKCYQSSHLSARAVRISQVLRRFSS